MTFRKCRKAYIVFAFALVMFMWCTSTQAMEQTKLSKADILIIYSDGISKEDMEQVRTMVEYLTYQKFKITYVPASLCVNQLSDFSSIICYKLEDYPKELIPQLYEREEEGNAMRQARAQGADIKRENDIRLLVIGNEFLRTYLDETQRAQDYIDSTKETGKLRYSFSDLEEKESLVKEEDFLFLKNPSKEVSGSIEVEGINGYFCAQVNALYHMVLTDFTNPLTKAAFVKEVAQWKWPYKGEPHAYAQYIVLNQVYPFQDPQKLLEVVNYLVMKEEPFVICVMPVYNHGNYPAMQRFCEVLKYAQANGGVIILNSPINQMPIFDIEVVNDAITTAIQIYIEQGVYPMGIRVPKNWMFNEDTIEVMSRFQTIFVSEEEDSLIKPTKNETTNKVYKDGHQWVVPVIQLDQNGISYLKTNSFAVDFDITKPMEKIEEKIEACIRSFVPLKSLWDVEHSFWTNEDVMDYQDQVILINEKRVEKEFTASEYDKEFQYKRNTLQRYSKDLTGVNKQLLIAVAFISFLFLSFIFAARHRNKQTFLIRKEKNNKDNNHKK